MSKKHRREHNQNQPVASGNTSMHAHASNMVHGHGAEYAIIKHDLVKVVILNIVYLAGLLVLYFTDQKSHYLEHWFSRVLHF